MAFRNNASRVGFIPKEASLDDVIRQDTIELKGIGGSFEAIADRMDYLIERVKRDYSSDIQGKRANIFRKYGYNTDELFDVPGKDNDPSTPRGKIMEEINNLFRTPGLVPGETEIEVVDILSTRGMQDCPFTECGQFLSSSDYIIRNTRTDRQLWINQTTSHLAREHHMLEKGNNYGISAKEFYQHFMPDGQRI